MKQDKAAEAARRSLGQLYAVAAAAVAAKKEKRKIHVTLC